MIALRLLARIADQAINSLLPMRGADRGYAAHELTGAADPSTTTTGCATSGSTSHSQK